MQANTNEMHEQNHVSGENAPDGDDHARPPNHHIADEPRGRLTANRGDDRTSSGCIGSNAIDTDHNDNDFPELPSSSKRRRCAKQLQQGCQRRRDKGTSIDGTPDFTDARDDDCQQKVIYCLDSESPNNTRRCLPQPGLRLLPTSPRRDPYPDS